MDATKLLDDAIAEVDLFDADAFVVTIRVGAVIYGAVSRQFVARYPHPCRCLG